MIIIRINTFKAIRNINRVDTPAKAQVMVVANDTLGIREIHVLEFHISIQKESVTVFVITVIVIRNKSHIARDRP